MMRKIGTRGIDTSVEALMMMMIITKMIAEGRRGKGEITIGSPTTKIEIGVARADPRSGGNVGLVKKVS